MTDLEIMENQSRLIEAQRRLFINTVKQFEKDLTYLRGTLASLWAASERDEPTKKSLEFSLSHLSEMQSMLNDFDARMADYERN